MAGLTADEPIAPTLERLLYDDTWRAALLTESRALGGHHTVGADGLAAQRAAEDAARKGMEQGLRQVEVLVRGPGAGREAAIRSLQGMGLMVTSIRDVTPIPHNGVRPRKRRRV